MGEGEMHQSREADCGGKVEFVLWAKDRPGSGSRSFARWSPLVWGNYCNYYDYADLYYLFVRQMSAIWRADRAPPIGDQVAQ